MEFDAIFGILMDDTQPIFSKLADYKGVGGRDEMMGERAFTIDWLYHIFSLSEISLCRSGCIREFVVLRVIQR